MREFDLYFVDSSINTQEHPVGSGGVDIPADELERQVCVRGCVLQCVGLIHVLRVVFLRLVLCMLQCVIRPVCSPLGRHLNTVCVRRAMDHTIIGLRTRERIASDLPSPFSALPSLTSSAFLCLALDIPHKQIPQPSPHALPFSCASLNHPSHATLSFNRRRTLLPTSPACSTASSTATSPPSSLRTGPYMACAWTR